MSVRIDDRLLAQMQANGARPLNTGKPLAETIAPKGAPPKVRGMMNGLEAEYAMHLDLRITAGEVRAWWFEGVTLKLADDCRYTADFLVQLVDGTLELHETKGHWRDDAKAKTRVAAFNFPFRVVAIQKRKKKDGGGFEITEF